MRGLLIISLLFSSLSYGQSRFDSKILKQAAALTCPVPDEASPVTVNATLVVEGDSLAVVVKTEILAGWHIYAFVPDNLPYIQLEPILDTPTSLLPAGTWSKSTPSASASDPGVLVYTSSAVFIQKFARKDKTGGKVKTGLYFQCCDIKQCLPPDERTFELTF
ncbi:protein-disulfide reductase DsbD domain-containing protein [Chitinophaga deserti]|uniref:protein-disulfide reductase DsbD domain-containing protein n=1 Tax=Chitinophaga deserti TaxID=2164099 RepID=UPI000D6D49AC|nr:protein-disulfide reductase DsbD domain-containing protein [Chitinophaga deserti]